MINLTLTQSLLACCIVLLIGRFLVSKIPFLAKYSIPEPIIGGIVFSLCAFLLSNQFNISITLETSIRSSLLLLFFACLGLTANLSLLLKGGPRLIILLMVLIPFLILQNAVGLGLAWLLDLHPLMGLLGGTITLVGGHGTGAAYADRFADYYNLQDVIPLSMTAATFGLILGGVIGGPVAEFLLKRNPKIMTSSMHIQASHVHADTAHIDDTIETETKTISPSEMITSLTGALIALVGGGYLAIMMEDTSISLPGFIWCLAIGIVIRNAGPKLGFRLNDKATDAIGSLMLAMFLGLTMMTLDLASMSKIAGPILIILMVQTLVCVLYTIFVVFRMQKRDYEAAVLSAAFCGIGLGTTATAIANMQAITSRHGPAPQSFIVVPITGAFLVDIMNVIILSSLLSLPFIGAM
ncbi:sodium/glutamate symporter [Aeromonas veronii]|uniref:sodium/glutamate symporter n=1 Tax=Aeromonas veronii TaxID=654 RepID=UPI0005C1ADAD|nr:sodium/glutamate symporter [Aeromonas veronii]ELI6424618.1 sodium/glutamate symporter [Aeromonas veronii]